MRERIGKFDLLKPLGHGAMGEVFLARDPMIGRQVAIKVIRQDSALAAARQDVVRERFFREARAAGALNHLNIVTIHEFGEDGDLLYLAMEYVEGEDLAVLLEQHSLEPPEALEVLAQVCDGLAHAHGKGVLHRDIKPSNIRVTLQEGRLVVKLMDFGIARQGGSDLTGTGTLVGTFSYMAPEYIQGGQASAASDLFAVGVILYEALSGRRAFEGDSGATVLYRIVHQQPERLEPAAIAGLSPAVQALVDRALAKDPRWRFADAAAMAAALRAARDPAWRGPQDWQEDATRETAGPLLPAGPVRPTPPATPQASAPRPVPIILTRPADLEEPGRPWLWPAAGALVLATVGGLWFFGREKGPRPVISQAPETAGPGLRPPPAKGGSPASAAAPAGTLPPSPADPAGAPPSPGAPPDPQTRPSPPPPPPRDAPRRDPEDFESALRDVETRPDRALDDLRRALLENPEHVPSHALRLYALHRLNRARDFREALDEARNAGVTPALMDSVPHFRRLIDEERRAPKLPKDVYGTLTEGLDLPPGPPGRRPGG
jgi:serine/threonine-protein kinase